MPAWATRRPAWTTRAGLTALAKRKSAWAVLGGVIAVAAGATAGVLLLAPGHPARLVPAKPRAAAAPGQKAQPKKPEKGFRVIVPSIGADAPVISVGASGPNGGALDVPSSVHQVGWWDGIWKNPAGTKVHEKVAYPGQPGVALLAGHIDSAEQGHGVFYKLKQAKPGADITVIDAHQKVTHWKVTRVQTVYKSNLPAGLFVNKGAPQLALVSCGGPFDAATGHYLDNIIAWAKKA